MNAQIKSPAETFTDSCGIEYTAEFVPQSKSRNAKDKNPSLNWRVTLSKNGRTLTTDYMQGCGHIPHYESRFSNLVIYDDAVRAACEHGASLLLPFKNNGYDAASGGIFRRAKPIPAPSLTEVLACLVLDSDVLEAAGFEDWARGLGYDTDSRSAEAIYRQCIDHALILRQMIDLDKAREAFQDY